jgi:hypothetical protein
MWLLPSLASQFQLHRKGFKVSATPTLRNDSFLVVSAAKKFVMRIRIVPKQFTAHALP